MRKNFTNEELDFIKENIDVLSYKEMAEKLGRNHSSINRKATELGLSRNDEWKEDEIAFLIENFDKLETTEISEKLNRTVNSVRIKSRKLGLKKEEKYTYDKGFFKNIDTEEKAYWLGFIFADGWISKHKRGCALGIQLGIKDYNHLKKFNKSINGNIEVAVGEHVCSLGEKKTVKHCLIRCYSKEMVEDLEALGVNQNKTYTENHIPDIREDLKIHFIRGYFDGDGCLFFNKKNTCHSCSIVSKTRTMLEDIRSVLYEKYNISSYISTDRGMFGLYIKGMKNAYNFCETLYNGASIFLDRKKELHEKITVENNIVQRILVREKQ